jgi:hypothetical protein
MANMCVRAADPLACSVSYIFEEVVLVVLNIYSSIALSFSLRARLGSRHDTVYLQYNIYWRPCYLE